MMMIAVRIDGQEAQIGSSGMAALDRTSDMFATMKTGRLQVIEVEEMTAQERSAILAELRSLGKERLAPLLTPADDLAMVKELLVHRARQKKSI